jgi:hypothetical protein
MDGRVQLPVIHFLQSRFNAEYVDLITEPGPNAILAADPYGATSRSILARLSISIKAHQSVGIAVVGHHDCAGNPADDDQQQKQTLAAVRFLRRRHHYSCHWPMDRPYLDRLGTRRIIPGVGSTDLRDKNIPAYSFTYPIDFPPIFVKMGALCMMRVFALQRAFFANF